MALLLSPQALVTTAQLGLLLKSARKRRKLTQSALAAQLGLSQNRVSYLELHPEALSAQQLLAWCAVVGLELNLGEARQDLPVTASEW